MKKSVAIFGGGPASLALASFIDPDLFKVTIYEQNKTCGRKFLVAGKGGFNLTHSEPLEQLMNRYSPSSFLEAALRHFTNEDLRKWLDQLGIETFVGSSKRVFPIQGIKPIQVLDAILKHILARGIEIHYQKKWNGWSKNHFPIINGTEEIKADYYVYAFGGGSWKVTGSDGHWAQIFKSAGLRVQDFEPSNCAFEVDWPDELISKLAGRPIKNVEVYCDEKKHQGELVITEFGLEGNAIYALSGKIRNQLKEQSVATIALDFKPMFELDKVEHLIANSKAKNNTELLRNDIKLSKTQITLIKSLSEKEVFIDRKKLSGLIKNFQISLKGMAPIDEAISTVGGIDRNELKSNFELLQMPNHFCVGEMVDWDAPTGGYLLQACFSMGAYLAYHLNGLNRNM